MTVNELYDMKEKNRAAYLCHNIESCLQLYFSLPNNVKMRINRYFEEIKIPTTFQLPCISFQMSFDMKHLYNVA